MDRVARRLGVTVDTAYKMRARDNNFPDSVMTQPVRYLPRHVDRYKALLAIDLDDYYTIKQIAALMPGLARSAVNDFVRSSDIDRRLSSGAYYYSKLEVDRLLADRATLAAGVMKLFNVGRYSRMEISKKLNVSITEIRSIIKRSHNTYLYYFSDGYTKHHRKFDTLDEAVRAAKDDILTDRAFAVSITCCRVVVRNTKQLFAEVYK